MQTDSKRNFVHTWLPWVVAAAALVLYGVTLNRVISITGLTSVARATGWDWHPVYTEPLYYLLTWPLRWLPAGWQLVGANLFGAACAAGSLALLARSVALLPHDRTRDQRQKETSDHSFLKIPLAWLPPVFAVLVCGLQITFWQNAVITTGESLNVLVFAYCVRCLLEYRVDQQESWVWRMALVFGLGMANHWTMVAFFPMALVATVWIMGRRFLQARFLLRFALCGLAGLSLYLLLPLLQSQSVVAQNSFWVSLKTNLVEQKNYIRFFPNYALLLLAAASVLPVFVMGIRWASSVGDISAAGFRAAQVMTHVIHALFLAASVYVAFDMPVSPHKLGRTLGAELPFLPLYYLSALSGGYFIGYFLLIFGQGKSRSWRRDSPLQPAINLAITVLACALLAVAPTLLVYQNLSTIRAVNSPELDRYARHLAASLPAKRAVVLSDDPIRLHALRALLGGSAAQNFVLLDTGSLKDAAYHRHLKLKYPERLPQVNPAGLSDSELIPFLTAMSEKVEVYYLHPSFGYYFESFSAQPLGLVYLLKPYPANSVEAPLPSARDLAENDARWKTLEAGLLAPLKHRVKSLTLQERLDNPTLFWMSRYLSRSLNQWGAELQRAGLFDPADHYFREALAVNPENPAAFINHEFNRHWVKNHKLLDRFSDEAMSRIMPYGGNWDYVSLINGPIAEPVFLTDYAQACARGGTLRQAAQALIRAQVFLPEDFTLKLALANIYTQNRWPDRALALLAELRAKQPVTGLDTGSQTELILAEARAHFVQGNRTGAETMVLAAQDKFPQQEGPFTVQNQFHLFKADELRAAGKTAESRAEITNVIRTLEKQLTVQPTNLSALINHGGFSLTVENYAGALPALNRALELDPANPAGLADRALAYLQLKRYDEARRDYRLLADRNSKMYRAYYGLGEIAWQKKERSDAINYYKLYLKHAPEGSPEALVIRERLAKLKKNTAF